MKKLFTLLCMALVSAVGFAQDAYDPSAHKAFVSGTDNMCTANWGGEETGDAMVYDANEGVWKALLFAKDTNPIEFKIVYDGGWYGKGDANYKFQVEEASDVLITFDPQTMIATYSGAKVIEFGFTLDDVQYIVAAGSAGLLNGLDWKIDEVEAAANKMTVEEKGYYTLELKGIPAGTYEFKFVANGSWSAAQWGAIEGDESLENGVAKNATADNGKNFKITLEKGAVYDITLTLDIMDFSKPQVTAEWKAAGDAPVEPDVYSLAGTMNEWNAGDKSTEMKEISDKVYAITLPLKAGTYEFKVVLNHDWSVNYGGAAMGQESDNAILILQMDADVTFTLDLSGEAPVLSTKVSSGSGVESIAASKKNTAIYNIAGQRVEKTTRGLYIVNGKKVVK